jgi:N-acyl-D-aspartate/D-glutamate deacylase
VSHAVRVSRRRWLGRAAALGWAALGYRTAAALGGAVRALATPASGAAGAGEVYDLVIHNARAMDPARGMDEAGIAVAVQGERIAAITRAPLRGRREIDAAGRVVAPGFIDILSYDPNAYGVWYKIADGVTTNLAMHGASAEMGAWYRAYERARLPLHFGGAFYYGAARARLGIGRYAPAQPAQIARLSALAARAVREGALGISMSPEYVPGTTTAEIEAMMRVAAAHRVLFSVHVRYSDMEPPGTNLDALREVLGAARRTGAAVHINHIHSTGGTFSMAESLRLLDEARADGVDVTACVYPYTFWATYLNSARFDPGWQRRFRIDHGDLQLAGTTERLTPASFVRYRQQGKVAVAYAIPEDDLVAALRSPLVMIGSDAILEPGNNNHPRAAGTFARTLRVYVRERRVLGLMEALAKMTIMPARRLEMCAPALRRKGRLQVGADADLVVFDPAAVADHATVEHPNRFSTGIDYVLVRGRVVKDPRGLRREVRAGRPVRAGPG